MLAGVVVLVTVLGGIGGIAPLGATSIRMPNMSGDGEATLAPGSYPVDLELGAYSGDCILNPGYGNDLGLDLGAGPNRRFGDEVVWVGGTSLGAMNPTTTWYVRVKINDEYYGWLTIAGTCEYVSFYGEKPMNPDLCADGEFRDVTSAPDITSTADVGATEDVEWEYPADVEDPDDTNNGVDLAWTLNDEPAGMVVSPTGVVTWTPREGVLTSGEVTLTVTDGDNQSDSEYFTITVTPVNDAPIISAYSQYCIHTGTNLMRQVSVWDSDDNNDGTELTWTLDDQPTGMVVSNTGVITWTPAIGITTSGEVTITVEDGGEDGAVVATHTFTVRVVNGEWCAPTPIFPLLFSR